MAKSNFNTDFYVYIHCRASDGRVFYVGKGSGQRAYVSQGRNRYWLNIVKKHGFAVSIIQDGMQEWWAHELECELIALYGRETLCNLTDGGEGISGLKRTFSDAHKAKISAKLTGRKYSIEMRQKMSERRKGKPLPKMFQENARLANKGRPMSQQQKENMSRVHLGKIISESHKQCIVQKLGKRVLCSNGMTFLSIGQAAEWLKCNGYPKASAQSVSRACTSEKRKAYGLQWKLT